MISQQKVIMKWHSSIKSYYISLGYVWTKVGDEFEVEVKHLPKRSNYKVKFICDVCHGKNQIQEKDFYKYYCNLTKEREKSGIDCCKKCALQRGAKTNIINATRNGNSLGEKYPHLIDEWHEDNEMTPFDYGYGSSKKVKWRCRDCKNCWEVEIGSRTISEYGCPYCTNQKIVYEKSLQFNYKDISLEWHSTKNGDLKPKDVFPHTNKKVWWQCYNGHEWETSPSKRVLGRGCPYCSNKKILIGYNDLQTSHPIIANEWNKNKNINFLPTEVSYGSNKLAWWQCKKCNHEWKMKIVKRTLMGSGCPRCSESKGEKKVREWLEQNKIKFEPQKEFDGLMGLGGGNLSYDFYLPELNILIEYQGEFHDNVDCVYIKNRLPKQKEHDERKRSFVLSNKINLIEIWYLDYENIEDILKNKINTHIRTPFSVDIT